MPVFHYALKPRRLPDARHAETVGAQRDLFAIADKKHRIYAQEDRPTAPPTATLPGRVRGRRRMPRAAREPRDRRRGAHRSSTRSTASSSSATRPPGVVVDEDLQIVQFRGQTGALLEPAPGEASLNAPEDGARRPALRAAHGAPGGAQARRPRCARTGLRVRSNGGWHAGRRSRSSRSPRGDGRTTWCSSTSRRREPRDARTRRGAKPARPPRGRRGARARPSQLLEQRARREPRVPPVDHPGAGGRQRGAPVGQRGDPVEQRGAPEHERGARDRQGGAAVAPTRSSTPSTRSCTAATRS